MKKTEYQVENMYKFDSDLPEYLGFEISDLSNRKDVSRFEFYDGNELVVATNLRK